jgi:hypothetical protein
MTHANIQEKNLSLLIYQYLNNKGVTCREANIDHLDYIWANIKYKPYSKEEFIDELVKNDIILKHTEQGGELEK